MSQHANTKIQMHKYTNTAYERIPERPKNTQTKYTNTKIQQITKYQKDRTGCIFLKRGLFKDIKNEISVSQTCKYKNTNTKYTNTAYGEVPERPNMLYIIEKRIVQGYQK